MSLLEATSAPVARPPSSQMPWCSSRRRPPVLAAPTSRCAPQALSEYLEMLTAFFCW